MSNKQTVKHSGHLLQALRGCFLALVVVLAATTAVAVVHTTGAPLNDGIDRYDPNFVKASLLVMGPGETEILRSKILTLEQQSKLDVLCSRNLIANVSMMPLEFQDIFTMLTTILNGESFVHEGEQQRGAV